MASAIPDPPTRPHPSSVERRSRGKWLQTAPQEPKSQVTRGVSVEPVERHAIIHEQHFTRDPICRSQSAETLRAHAGDDDQHAARLGMPRRPAFRLPLRRGARLRYRGYVF